MQGYPGGISQVLRISFNNFYTDPSRVKPFLEAVTGGVPYKKPCLKFLQYSQENSW